MSIWGTDGTLAVLRGKVEDFECSLMKDNIYGFTKKNSNRKESFMVLLLEILSNVQNPLEIALSK